MDKSASTNPVPAPRRVQWRGFLLDEARHFFGKEAVKALLERMAAHGLNVFHWHLTDDQGWRIDLPGMPELVRFGARRSSSPPPGEDNTSDGTPYGPFFYTADDIREIVAFASDLGIDVVPEIDLPGHVRALLAAHPEFACEGVRLPREPLCSYGICPDVLCPGSDAAVAFCERLLDAVCGLFPSEFIHLGGDECPTARWKACLRCQARIRSEGLPNESALQGWLMRRLVERLAGRGRRAVVWNEALACGDLPPSTIVQAWNSDAAADAAAAARKGHDVILSPLRETYFSIPEGLPDDPYRYRAWVMKNGWTLPAGRVRAFDPFAYVPPELSSKVLGGECCAWSEVIHDRAELEYKVFRRLAAFGEAMRRTSANPVNSVNPVNPVETRDTP